MVLKIPDKFAMDRQNSKETVIYASNAFAKASAQDILLFGKVDAQYRE